MYVAGDSDAICRQLADLLGWTEDFNKILHDKHNWGTTLPLVNQSNTENLNDAPENPNDDSETAFKPENPDLIKVW